MSGTRAAGERRRESPGETSGTPTTITHAQRGLAIASRARRRRRGRARWVLGVAVAAALAAACDGARGGEKGRASGAFRGPIVLVSWSALSARRAEGAPSDTPELDRFLAGATWSGTGIASSSWCGGSLATVFTGVGPALHGAGHPAHPWLRPQVRTLAEELAAAGFSTTMFHSNPWLGPRFGLARGFANLRAVRRRAAERHLAALDGGPSFTWIQLALPGAAVAFDSSTVEHAPAAGSSYAERARDADRRFGRLLDALRQSGRFEETILVVLADHGATLGADGSPLPGEAIGRETIEVPLAIQTPSPFAARLPATGGATVGLDRLFATLMELAGLRPPPVAAPSLLRRPTWAALSELWFANGYHELGVYEDGHRLRWRCQFAPPAADFDRARREALGSSGSARWGEIVSGFEAAFRRRTECALGEEVALERWPAEGGTTPVDDPARRDLMLERLRHLRTFPPPWSLEPARPLPIVRRRDLRALAGWGLPLPAQWAAP